MEHAIINAKELNFKKRIRSCHNRIFGKSSFRKHCCSWIQHTNGKKTDRKCEWIGEAVLVTRKSKCSWVKKKKRC